MIWVYPGSFDPVTDGHIDIMRRAAKLCETLYVAVLENRGKTPLFSLEQRKELLLLATEGEKNIRVGSFSGLLVDYCKSVGAVAVIRGARSGGDFEAECVNAQVNRAMSGIETLVLPASPALSCVSSSVLRDVALHGGDITSLVREDIARMINGFLERK